MRNIVMDMYNIMPWYINAFVFYSVNGYKDSSYVCKLHEIYAMHWP